MIPLLKLVLKPVGRFSGLKRMNGANNRFGLKDIGKKDPPALPQESRLQNLAGKKDLLASSQNQAYLYGPAQKTESTTVA